MPLPSSSTVLCLLRCHTTSSFFCHFQQLFIISALVSDTGKFKTEDDSRPTRRASLAGCSWKDWVEAWLDGVPVSARTGTSLPRWSSHPCSLWCCSSPTLSRTWKPVLSHCASLSTQHVRLRCPTVWNSLPGELKTLVVVHHHHVACPCWSVAVSTISRHRSRS